MSKSLTVVGWITGPIKRARLVMYRLRNLDQYHRQLQRYEAHLNEREQMLTTAWARRVADPIGYSQIWAVGPHGILVENRREVGNE